MPQFKELSDYGAARREQKLQPVGFRWGGVDYAARPVLPAFVILDFTENVDEHFTAAHYAFVRDALTPAAWAKFEKVIRDERLDQGALYDIVNHLVDQYTAPRPTKEPSSSRRSPSKAGARSRSGSASKASPTP